MKRIAVIGTGIMGSGIVKNYLKNKYKVYVWNRNKDKLKELVSLGAVAVNLPQDAAKMADIVFEVTANDESSESVWLGDSGILAGANKNKILITNATLSIPWIDKLALICEQRDFQFLDMPMTGGRIGAETGQLVLLTGGNENLLQILKPDLKVICTKIIYFGKAGSGMRYKLILNMLQGIHITALGEVLSLAKEMGLDLKNVGDSLAERPGGTTTNLAWRDFQKQPKPINFSVDWITKDLRYAKKAAVKTKTPLLDQTLENYNKAILDGLGQKDWTIINIDRN